MIRQESLHTPSKPVTTHTNSPPQAPHQYYTYDKIIKSGTNNALNSAAVLKSNSRSNVDTEV